MEEKMNELNCIKAMGVALKVHNEYILNSEKVRQSKETTIKNINAWKKDPQGRNSISLYVQNGTFINKDYPERSFFDELAIKLREDGFVCEYDGISDGLFNISVPSETATKENVVNELPLSTRLFLDDFKYHQNFSVNENRLQAMTKKDINGIDDDTSDDDDDYTVSEAALQELKDKLTIAEETIVKLIGMLEVGEHVDVAKALWYQLRDARDMSRDL